MNDLFRRLAQRSAAAVGTPWAFFVACLVVIVWASTGPAFHYADTWQLVINTGTTIVTFLMVFLIQNSQNRDGQAIQLKLDELIRAIKGARNDLIDLENCSAEELERLRQQFERMSKRGGAQTEAPRGTTDRTSSSS